MESLGAHIVRIHFDEFDSSMEMWSSLLHDAKQPSFATRMGTTHGDGEAISGVWELLRFIFVDLDI